MTRGRAPAMDMYHVLHCIILLVTLIGITTPTTVQIHGPTEYCFREVFNATCGAGEVVLVVSAEYGRMALGRCVRQELGFLGCATDVLGILDARCSGKRSCMVNVDDDALYSVRACPDDTTMYLYAAYSCIAVATDQDRSCVTQGYVPVQETSGYLATSMAETLDIGTERCPWVVTVEPGRRVNLTLFNFLQSTSDSDLQIDSSVCYEIGVVREVSTEKKILTCGSDARQKNILISTTNSVEIAFADRSALGFLGSFLVHYQASGCTEPVAPAGAHVQRDGAVAIILCDDSDQSWTLTCDEGRWSGRQGNCTLGIGWDSPGFFSSSSGFPYGILIIVSIGVALGVFVGGILLSCVIFYVKSRRHELPDGPPQAEMDPVPADTMRSAKIWVDEPSDRANWSTYGTSTMRSHHHYRDHDPRQGGRDKYSADSGYDPSVVAMSPRHHTEYDPRHHIYECPQFS